MPDISLLPGPKPQVDFTTSLFSENERFSYWRDVICAYLSPSESERISPQSAFSGSLRQMPIGKTGICEIEFSPMRNFRDANCLRRMPDDDIFVAFMKCDGAQLIQDERCANPNFGDVVVYDSAQQFEWQFKSQSRMLVARFSRRQMVSRVPKIETLTARVIKARSPLASIIGNTMNDMLRFDDNLDSRYGHRLGNSFIDLVTCSIEACLVQQFRSPVDSDLLSKAKSYLSNNIEDPDIDPSQMAAHLGVSIRTLYRVFTADGTTATKWLWQKRLELAFRLLSEGQVKNVSQVAMQCGFNDFSHFSRTFRKAYGVMPKSVLRKATNAK
ncbi:AraC family transcriptional regulator [Pseudotabrizicola sp. 4114]|uniref:AraC family transcriptional regulator n=1 Tax=Pseudotabrizicola sp. 4114 TaxID=2817731 RepID=UPI002860BF1F|nr:AraC-like DNA-binding protein [Pseudorhodobacter sp. 4114]